MAFTLFKQRAGRVIHSTDPGYRTAPWYFEFEFRRSRYKRSLQTPDAAKAQARASQIHRAITEAVIAKDFDRLQNTRQRQPSASTIGEILAAYERHAHIRSARRNTTTLRGLIRKARALAPGANVDTLCSTILNGQLIRDYQTATVDLHADDLTRRTQIITCNSVVRQARSVVGPQHADLYKEAGIRLPDLSTFRTVRMFKQPRTPFVPIPQATLNAIWENLTTLRDEQPNAYRAFLLAEGAGLRRSEAARVTWDQISHVIVGGTARTFLNLGIAKNGHPRMIPLDTVIPAVGATVHDELLRLRTLGPAPQHILEGTYTDRYRHTFDDLSTWLRTLGWDRKKTAHELRKHCGSLWAEQHGTRVGAVILGNTEEVFRSHYDAMLTTPTLKIG